MSLLKENRKVIFDIFHEPIFSGRFLNFKFHHLS